MMKRKYKLSKNNRGRIEESEGEEREGMKKKIYCHHDEDQRYVVKLHEEARK